VAFSPSEKLEFCETCYVCKSHVRRISREPADRNVGVFEVVGFDFCGLMNIQSLGRRRYNLCAVDFRSRFMLHDTVRSTDEAPASFRRMLSTIRSLGHTVRRLRVDNDTVFLGAPFRNLLDEFNITVEITAPYAHWQHGRIERQWGTSVPMTESMVRQTVLPKSYWALATATAVHVRNHVHSGGAGGEPFTLGTGRRADLSSMPGFGCPAYVDVDKSQRRYLTIARGRGSFWGTLPSHRRGWCTILLLVGWRAAVTWCSTRLLSSPWGRALRSNAMMMKRTASRAPCAAKNGIHLRGSRRYGSRYNIPGRWKMNGTCIRGRLHVQGIIFDPLHDHSNAYPIQGIISVKRALREMDGLRKVPQLLSQPAARLFKSRCHTSKR
jgi:hypothetical protein